MGGREQVGNFAPDEDRVTDLHAGMMFIIKLLWHYLLTVLVNKNLCLAPATKQNII